MTVVDNYTQLVCIKSLSHPFVIGTILNVVWGWSRTSLKESLILENYLSSPFVDIHHEVVNCLCVVTGYLDLNVKSHETKSSIFLACL